MSFMSLFMKPGDEQPRKRKRNLQQQALQPGQKPLPDDIIDDPEPQHIEQSAPPALVDIFDHGDLFSLQTAGDPMFCKPEDFYQHPVQIAGAPTQVAHVFSSLTLATSPRDGLQKSCSVCGRVESKTCKIGHRLQSCKERNHTDCKLVCNSCEDFFRRHSGGVNLKERCDSSSRDPAQCLGGKTSRNCQYHRYERCLEVGMQPVPSKDAKELKPCVSPVRLPDASPSMVLGSVACAAAAATVPTPMAIPDPPTCLKQTLPDWDSARNIFNAPEMRWKAFCASLSISSSAEMPAASIEEFLAQKIRYSDLLLKYSGEEASAIWHERGSLRLCVESFFAVSRDGFSPADIAAMQDQVAFGLPVCVHVDYVAQKPMVLGRDLVPVQVPSSLPMHAKAYQAYRSSIPNVVAVVERKEKTTTPPFAAPMGSYMTNKPLGVSFILTSKIPGKTWLYIRRKGEKVITAVVPNDPIEISDGDTLSIWNEHTEMAEHIAWRLSIPQAM
eukprot:m.220689 g.220689  ORF g.220689 m.220689 type:complete len:499 (-) comp10435_c0_seq1:116-1612(-)